MNERVCLATYHEIGLKGRNRSAFERRLQDNVDAALAGMGAGRSERVSSRLAVPVVDAGAVTAVAERMALLPGINTVVVGVRTAADLALIRSAALAMLREAGPFSTFAVESKRSNTRFAISSQELNRLLGAHLQAETGAGVDLGAPDVTVSVIVSQSFAYVACRKVAGVGGLPVGTAGSVVSLLSSGIDSPVSTWRMMRRGAVVIGVHFSGRPQVSGDSELVVAEIARVLERNGGLGRVYIVPFGDIQKEIALAVPPDLRVLMYRRLMLRVAEAIAHVEHARALVTGESLGQVASQTLENIAAVDEAATMPVLRPLIGTDKLEIMAEARRIGTYELSIQDTSDCCTLFMPRNPETHAKMHVILRWWNEVPHERMVADALGAIEWIDFECPAYRPPRRWPAHSEDAEER